jgi:hypothetical protein
VKKLLAFFFVFLLSTPLVLELSGRICGTGDRTGCTGFPAPGASYWLDPGYYKAVDGWFRDSLGVEKPLKTFHNWVNYHLFRSVSGNTVRVGIHGWLFAEKMHGDDQKPSVGRRTGQRLFMDLYAAEKMISAAGRRLLVVTIPDKADIYPEYLGSTVTTVSDPTYQALVQANDRHPLGGLIALGPVLKKAKLSGIEVYGKTSRLWSCEGAAAGAKQILAVENLPEKATEAPLTVACPPPDRDLYRRLLDEYRPKPQPPAAYAAGPYAVNGPAAVICGDGYLTRLLPYISPAFKSLKILDSSRYFTLDGSVLAGPADLVILESGVDRLSRWRLNLESIYKAGRPSMLGVVRQTIALDKALPLSGCALDISSGGLKIRSSGEKGFFSLPPLAGSTDKVFRMVKLTFSPSLRGPVTVRTRPDASGSIHKSIKRDTPYLIIPLPFGKSTVLQINPSRHPGVFTLQQAELLSFYGNLPPQKKNRAAAEDIYNGLGIEPTPSPEKRPPNKPAPPAINPPEQSPPVLDLTDIDPDRVFQRRGGAAEIVVSGSYTGITGPVEARVVKAGSQTVVVPWTVVDHSPANGLYTGILPRVPQGGWYRLQVRSGIVPDDIKKGVNRWGVGMLIACIGQSNMNEWFYAGHALAPSPLLRVYRNEKWIEPGRSGNGALALGNRLASRLKIPIGLLDYAVDGSGLTPKADWGTGYWLDPRPKGIYRRFIDAVDAIGGTVEYVVWMQGEADAARGTVGREEYRQALERLADVRLRADIKNGSSLPRLPFLMIPLVRRPTGRDITCQWIREAQMDALRTIDQCYLAAMSMDLKNRGRQHLMPAAYTTLGIRTAQTILYLLGKAAYHRGPFIASVSRESDRLIDITIHHRGGTDFTPRTGISGFEVHAGQKTLAIASVKRQNSDTIRIELKTGTPEAVKVRYLYGAHPDTTAAVHDNTALRLPLEPFSQ